MSDGFCGMRRDLVALQAGLSNSVLGKKRRHERSSCSCREASDATYFQLRYGIAAAPITGIYTP